MAGVIAADNNNLNSLQAEITRLEQKTVRNKVSVTNYFPVLKFYVHLKALEGVLRHDLNVVLKNIDEAKRIRKKMGYWGSLFNMPYFFTDYAGMLLQFNRDEDALVLLRDADQYNPSFPGCHLGLARIHLKVKDLDRAREEWQKASSLLETADQDFILTRELKKIGQKLTEAGR
jgi:tetratricopeptide (TPR) repeat protein